MCFFVAGYHWLLANVKQNHDTSAANQKEQLSIRSAQKTWSVFAEAYDADAREFWISTPKF